MASIPKGRQYYYIKSKLSGYVLDISGIHAYDGCSVALWEKGDCKGNQLWRFDAETKTIRSEDSDNYVLDINESDGLIVNKFDSDRADQRWQRDDDKLLNVDDPRYCIDVYESDDQKGARVIKYPFYGTDNQFWDYELPNRQKFYIASQLHGKVVTINASGKLEIQPKASPVNQNQLFYANARGYLFSAAYDLALNSKRGEQFGLAVEASDLTTQWKFNESVTKVVNAQGDVLDVQGGSTADGTPLASWHDFVTQTNQLFRKELL